MVKSRDRIVEIIAEELEVERAAVSEDSALDALGADSPHLLEIALAIEEEFNVEIPDRELARFRTVSDVIFYVKEEAGA